MSRKYEVLLCGYYGFGNLGDELLALSLIGLLEENGVSPEKIALLSNCPERTSATLGIDCYNRWSMSEIWKVLKMSGSLLLGGGGLFQDSTSRRSCIYYWGLIRLALITGAIPWAFGQSVGPFRTRTGLFLARNGLSKCVILGIRDQGSMDILNEWGLKSIISPDPVLSLRPLVREEERQEFPGKLLINIRPWKGDLAGEMIDSLDGLDSGKFSEVLLVALSEEDERISREFIKNKETLKGRAEVVRVRCWQDVERIWTGACAAIGMRLHFCIFSFIYSVPFTAVPYDPKVRFFANSCGMDCWEGSGSLSFPLCKRAFSGENAEKTGHRVRTIFADSFERIRGALQE